MKRDYLIKSCLTLWAVLAMSVGTFAQQITVNGVVQDTQGEPIVGANVLIKGTTQGTITDLDGNFQLTADADVPLVISFIGYVTQELPAQPIMNVTLQEDTELLDEVVVIGYGQVKKNDLSGSVVALKAEELNKGAVKNTSRRNCSAEYSAIVRKKEAPLQRRFLNYKLINTTRCNFCKSSLVKLIFSSGFHLTPYICPSSVSLIDNIFAVVSLSI